MSHLGEQTQAVAMQAAEWYLELQAGTASMELRAAFADWLRRSPVHVEEFLRVVTLQADLARLPELARLDVDALVTEISRTGGAQNVIDLPRAGRAIERSADREPPPRAGPAGPSRGSPTAPSSAANAAATSLAYRRARARRVVGAGIAASATLVVGFLIAGHSWLDRLLRTTHYTTGIGEQRSVNLRDGSEVQINVRSDLTVRVDATSRDIRLQDGEALFHVAKDPRHPFRVRTPDAVVEAKGTQFDVRVRDGRTVVVLLEGHVLVSHPPADGAGSAGSGLIDPAAVTLDPGQMVTVAAWAGSALQPREADVAAATAWVQHRLVFDDAPLSQVVEEFNRYSTEPMVIDDPTVGSVRITASFAASNAPLFARSVAAAGDLRVTRGADGTWHIGRR